MSTVWRKSAWLRLPVVASALFPVAGLGSAQPANDECATPTVLVDGLNGGLTNVAATVNPLDPPFTCANAVDDVWFTYTPSCSGTVVLAMCPAPAVSSIDTVMEVFSGTCGSLTLLACDDDSCGGAGGSQIVLPGATAGVPLLVRVGSFATPPTTVTGTFSINASCTAVLVDDFGDASGATVARHTNAVGGARLGTAVSADAVTPTPAWYGDAGDDGIVSVANLSPGTTTGQIVVSATNPSASSTSFCRLWVDRNNVIGWSPFTDAFPAQSATVGAAPVNFTFGPFSMLANSPPSPFVRVRLASTAGGVSAATGTAAFGECEDYVLPGTGGPVMTPQPTGGGADAGDAPIPYPPASSTFINSERLGSAVTPDTNAPVGFPGSSGTAAWNDDANDDGIVRIEGLVPGGSCTLVLRAVDPVATFTDNVGAWLDFDGDGSWDDVGEAFAPVQLNIGPTPVTVTLGPLAVPATVGATVAARLKLAYAFDPTHGAMEAAGNSFEWGEVEDYLLPVAAGTGCGIGPNGTPTIWAEDPPRQGLPFTWKEANLSPGSGAFLILDSVNFLPGGIDVFLLAGPIIAPGTCFLYTGLSTIAPIGAADPNGDLSVTLPVPAGSAGTVYLQSFQIGPALTIFMTPVLPLTILP